MSINGGILVTSYAQIQANHKQMLKYFQEYNEDIDYSNDKINLDLLFFEFDFRDKNVDAFCRRFRNYYQNKDTPFAIGDNIIFSSGDRLSDEYSKMLDVFISTNTIKYEFYETW